MSSYTLAFLFLLQLFFIQGLIAAIVTVTPAENTVLPRQSASFVCKVSIPLQYCRVEIPGVGVLNLKNNTQGGGVSYYGSGLNAGQCGFTINSVEDKNNGEIKCFLGIDSELQEATASMRLIVARPPKAPELELSSASRDSYTYRMNEILHASCIIRDGRPAANISWYLDEEPLYEGLGMSTVLDLANEDLHSTIQNLTRTLLPSDNGRFLRCVSSHPALLGRDSSAVRQLDVKYPPLPQQYPIDKFGYEIGKVGIISVEIDANPKPQLEWSVRDQRIKEGTIDSTGRIEAEIAQDQGRGHYVANLKIAAITKQDTETQYILTAYNAMGTQDYTILISTSPEPEGVDLSIGGIIGIIVALLIVLLIIFTVVIARINGRWCFSGGAHVIDYTNGDDRHHQGTMGTGGEGVDNPQHQASQEYINGNDTTIKKKEEKINTDV